MSTRIDKCLGCGAGELDASSGVIVYVCGTTVSQFGISRSTTCHGIEVATLRRRIAALEAHIARLEKAGDRMMRGVPAGFHYPSSEEAAWTKAKEAKP